MQDGYFEASDYRNEESLGVVDGLTKSDITRDSSGQEFLNRGEQGTTGLSGKAMDEGRG